MVKIPENKKDKQDTLSNLRDEFHIPKTKKDKEVIYFAGNSLGLQPKGAALLVEEELADWARLGVEGHLEAKRPWLPYHELFSSSLSKLVGSLPSEVVAMNTLTVNLHLMMVSFYQPTTDRKQILHLASAFPSDHYALASQARIHGYSPGETLIPVGSEFGVTTNDDILEVIEERGQEVALVLLEGVNYLTGYAYDIETITKAAKSKGCLVGWDLAHGIGNVEHKLHDWGVDFAVWCSYKYLNGGPGCVGGCFVHDIWHRESPKRMAGWWGQNKQKRFEMSSQFQPIASAEGWQLSNPPILSLAPLLASLRLFDRAGIGKLREKSVALTGYLMERLGSVAGCEILTPQSPSERGAQVSVKLSGNAELWKKYFTTSGVVCDHRNPDIFRFAPTPLYNRFQDVDKLVSVLEGKGRP